MGEKEQPGIVWPYIERMENDESVKKVYLSSVEGPNRRGRPLGRWGDKVREYVSEASKVGSGQGGSVWIRGEVEVRLPWPPPCGMLPERARRRSYGLSD